MKFSDMDSNMVKLLVNKNICPTMGGDPEFFISNKRGKVLNADRFFPSKHNAICNAANKVFFDGIQGEMAIGYSSCRDNVIHNTRDCLKIVRSRIPDDHDIVLKPSAKIDQKVIEGADPEARIFGCAPDFNAYTKSINTAEMDASRHPFRYAGGHIHLGISSNYLKKGDTEYDLVNRDENHLKIIKFLDLIVTIPTLMLDNSPAAKRRRSKYGKAGCFRPTPYGVEYRTPSCWWLRSPMTVSLIFGLAKLAWTMLVIKADTNLRNIVEPDEEVIRGIIDESDSKKSYEIWKKLRPYIAIAGQPDLNPLNIGSTRTTNRRDVVPAIDNFITSKTVPALRSPAVFSLAVFEYAIKNGLDSITSKHVDKEWSIGKYPDDFFTILQGFVYGSFKRFAVDKDFLKFQNSMLKELY